MRKSILRFSIRRGIVVVAISAILLGGGVAASKWLRLYSAERDYVRAYRLYHEEGRVTCLELAFRSRCLMEAQCDLVGSTRARIDALGEHIRRLQSIRDEEARDLATELDCRGVGRIQLEEFDGILVEAKALPASQ